MYASLCLWLDVILMHDVITCVQSLKAELDHKIISSFLQDVLIIKGDGEDKYFCFHVCCVCACCVVFSLLACLY